MEEWLPSANIHEAFFEKIINTLYISFEIEIRHFMTAGNHLWEIQNDKFVLASQHDIKFIKIRMN